MEVRHRLGEALPKWQSGGGRIVAKPFRFTKVPVLPDRCQTFPIYQSARFTGVLAVWGPPVGSTSG